MSEASLERIDLGDPERIDLGDLARIDLGEVESRVRVGFSVGAHPNVVQAARRCRNDHHRVAVAETIYVSHPANVRSVDQQRGILGAVHVYV